MIVSPTDMLEIIFSVADAPVPPINADVQEKTQTKVCSFSLYLIVSPTELISSVSKIKLCSWIHGAL